MSDPAFTSEPFLAVLRNSPVLRLAAGDELIRQSDPSDAAYFLAEGSLSIAASTRYGRVVLSTVQAPRLVGEIGVLADLPRTASISAASAATVHRIDRELLLDLGQKMPALLLAVISQLGRQIATINGAIGLYTQALEALERREFDQRILEDLRNPPAPMREFAEVFQRFARAIYDKRRQEDEMASAAAIQRSLLPRAEIISDVGSRLDIAAQMRPARDVGGDFYDLIPLGDGRIALAVGDVCGKGLPASLFMSVAVSVLRTAAREHSAPAAAIARANAILCRDNAASMFATAFFGVYDPKTGELEYCNCGHNAPILLSGRGETRLLRATGLPLAMFDDRSASSVRVILEPGDLLVIYSDGLSEAINPLSEEFGDDRLSAAVAGEVETRPAETILSRLFAAVDAFAGGAEQADDMTCIVVRR